MANCSCPFEQLQHSVKHFIYATYARWNHIGDTAPHYKYFVLTLTSLYLLYVNAFVCIVCVCVHVSFLLMFCYECHHQSLLPLLSTNSPVHSQTQSGPVSGQSIPGSIPSVTGQVLRASDWPGLPLVGGARGSRPVLVGQPIWGTRLLWPQQWRQRAPVAGCSAGSPGHPGSGGHCSARGTAP